MKKKYNSTDTAPSKAGRSARRLESLLDKVHLYIEIDRQIGILMSRVDGSADIEVDVGSLLEQHAAYELSLIHI